MEEKVMNLRGSRNNMRGAVGNKGVEMMPMQYSCIKFSEKN